METRKIIICRGIQGSGKSTWAKQWCHEDPEHRIRINNDDIRNMLGDYWVTSREPMVKALYTNSINYAMSAGYDIVIDNMNLNPKTVKEIESFVDNDIFGDYEYKIEFKDFWTPVDECIRRDAKRENPIGEKVIKQTWRRYRDFIIHESIMAAKNKMLVQTDIPLPVICLISFTSFISSAQISLIIGTSSSFFTILRSNKTQYILFFASWFKPQISIFKNIIF